MIDTRPFCGACGADPDAFGDLPKVGGVPLDPWCSSCGTDLRLYGFTPGIVPDADDEPDGDDDIIVIDDPCSDDLRVTMTNTKLEIVEWLDGVGVIIDPPAWSQLTKAELLDWVDDICNEDVPALSPIG